MSTPARIRVAIADDQEPMRSALAMVVRASLTSTSSERWRTERRWWSPCLRHRVDVVLVDVRMPRMDGIEATRRIVSRSDAPRVIVVTTFDLDEYAFAAIRAGASESLLKDARAEEIVDAIRVVHAGHAVVSPPRPVASSHTSAAPTTDDGEAQRVLEQRPREQDVFLEVAKGASNAEIAKGLFLSEATVKTHVGHVLGKTRAEGPGPGRRPRLRVGAGPARSLTEPEDEPRWSARRALAGSAAYGTEAGSTPRVSAARPAGDARTPRAARRWVHDDDAPPYLLTRAASRAPVDVGRPGQGHLLLRSLPGREAALARAVRIRAEPPVVFGWLGQASGGSVRLRPHRQPRPPEPSDDDQTDPIETGQIFAEIFTLTSFEPGRSITLELTDRAALVAFGPLTILYRTFPTGPSTVLRCDLMLPRPRNRRERLRQPGARMGRLVMMRAAC